MPEKESPLLETYWNDGDWMLLVTYRYALDRADLNPKDAKQLRKLDCDIADAFFPDLLEKYAFLEENVTQWWDR